MGSTARTVAVLVLSLTAAACSAGPTSGRGRTAEPQKVAAPTANLEPSIDPNGGSCLERGLTAFCDDVFTGPNKVTVHVQPTAARPGQKVRVFGVSDCGDGVLDVGYATSTGRSVPVRLSWTSAPHGLSAFSGAFVVPHMRPGIIDVGALAFCRDASYQNSTSTALTVLGEQ